MNAYRALVESFEAPIFKSMLWMNPANDLKYIANHFKITLGVANFDIQNIENEWKALKRLCSRNYPNIKSPLSFWQRILTYRQEE